MSTPDQPRHDEPRQDQHGRAGGVRGAINDLLGRNDRPEDARAADDRRPEDERLAQGRADAGVGSVFDDSAGRSPAGAQHVGEDVRNGGLSDGSRTSGSSVVGAAAPERQVVGDRVDGPATGATPGSARHTDVGQDGPGYAAPAQGRADQQVPGQQMPGHQTPGQPTPGQPTPGQQVTGQQVADQPGSGQLGADQRGADQHGADQHLADQRGADQRLTDHRGADQHLTDAGAGSAGARTVDVGGNGAADPAAATDRHAAQPGSGTVASTSQGEDSEGRERLVSTERAESYGSRWDAVKGEFVDEPRKAVADADALVGELLDELQTLFTEQRKGIERSMATDETSTEDMRLALRRYRSFFDRLLSI